MHCADRRIGHLATSEVDQANLALAFPQLYVVLNNELLCPLDSGGIVGRFNIMRTYEVTVLSNDVRPILHDAAPTRTNGR
jgi:hypothetical protein